MTDPAAPSPPSGGLRQRIPTAIVLAVLLLLDLFALPPLATLLLIAIVLLGGAWEWSAFLNTVRPMRIAYVALIGFGLLIFDPRTLEPFELDLLLMVSGVWWVIAFGWIAVAPSKPSPVLAALAGVLALVPTSAALGYLRLADERGAWLVLFVMAVIMAADVGAYFFGHAFGRVKLAPQVSPGKTWEGVLGGVALSQVLTAIGAQAFGWPLAWLAPLALAAVAFSIVGDLTESLLKRQTGVKDSGRLLPGHGGVLDRIDSLVAGAPIFVFGLVRAGLVG